MLINLILVFLGYYAISKKQIKISSKRQLNGDKARQLGVLFFFTGTVGILGRDLSDVIKWQNFASIINILYLFCLSLSVILTFYLVFFAKVETIKK